MKLGLLTAAFPALTLDEVSTWAAENGFEAIEIAVWPTGGGAARRYAGTAHIDVATLDQPTADRIVGDLAAKGLTISALAYYPNPLSADPAESAAAFEHLRAVIRAAAMLGVPTVSTFAGGQAGFVDGSLDRARFQHPSQLVYDRQHHCLDIIDNYRVRRLVLGTTGSNYVETIAGSDQGFADGLDTRAKFGLLVGLAMDATGNLFVADQGNRLVRKVTIY